MGRSRQPEVDNKAKDSFDHNHSIYSGNGYDDSRIIYLAGEVSEASISTVISQIGRAHV